MNRRRVLLAVLVLFILFTGSCWDRHELNQIGVVMGAALDPGPEDCGETIEITTQIHSPEKGGGFRQPFENIAAIGHGAADAETRLALKSARNMFFGQTQLIILGENLAREDIRIFLERPGLGFEVRRSARIVVAEGVSGKDLLSAEIPLAHTPVQGIVEQLDLQAVTGLIPDIRMRDLLARLDSETAAAVVPAFTMRPEPGERQGAKPILRYVGAAVFKNGTVNGYLSPTETRGLLWTQGKVPLGVIKVHLPGAPSDQVIGLQIRRNFAKTKMNVEDDRVSANIDIEVRADIAEYGILRDISKPHSFSLLNRRLSRFVENEVREAVRKSRDGLEADIFDFGGQLRIQDNRNWQRLKPVWQDIYPNIEVHITVKAIMRHRGTTIGPPGITPS